MAGYTETDVEGFSDISFVLTLSAYAYQEALPLVLAVEDNAGNGGTNGVKFDTSSTTAGGTVTLQNAFAEVVKEASSYTMTNGQVNLFDNGTLFDVLNVSPYAGNGALKVGVADHHTYIYNCADSVFGSSTSGHTMGGAMQSLVSMDNTSAITALPMHA